jgi:transcriptional regulator with XRE-family HTH domain
MIKPRYDKALFKALGQAVTNRREQLQQSVEDLAELTGLGTMFIQDLEVGVRNVNLVNLSKVCRGLNLTLWELFYQTESLLTSSQTASAAQAAAPTDQPMQRDGDCRSLYKDPA